MLPIIILIFTFGYIYSNYYYSETAEEGLVENEDENEDEEKYETRRQKERSHAFSPEACKSTKPKSF